MDDSAIICDELIDTYAEDKSNDKPRSNDKETNFNKKKATCKTQKFYVLLTFLLIIIVPLIAVSIYCYLIKYRTKQKHLIPFQLTNNKLKEIVY